MHAVNRRAGSLVQLGVFGLLWIYAACGGAPTSGASSGAAGVGASNTGAAALAAAGGGPGAAAATFSQIYDMLFPMPTNARCVACHALPPNDIANGNLHTGNDRATAYAALVGKMSTSSRCMNAGLVVAYHPEMSLLLQKLSASPPCGSRMPLGGNPLSDAQLEMVRSWIAAGAQDN